MLDDLTTPNLQPHRCIESQSVASGGDLWTAKYYADLAPNLIDKDDEAASFRQGSYRKG